MTMKFERVFFLVDECKEYQLVDHRDLIKKCCENGYKYVGCIPVAYDTRNGAFNLNALDLIFEKEEKSN